MNNLNQTIYSTIQRVAKRQSLEVGAIHDQDALVDNLGLKSLDLARMIAILELKLDLDPFAELVSITSIRTVGDLCAAYAKCFEVQNGSATQNSTPEAEPAAGASTSRRARQRTQRKSARSSRA
ncbi:MAG: acyl carrier protein [Ardenticatenaceae bacterium]